MEAATIWEWVGYLASVVVAISLMMSNIKKLRWWNLIGAALFVAYGLAIGAIPVALVNFFIVLIDIYYLVKLYKEPESPPS
ncbi:MULTISPECIES: YgjV family protein [Shewanella]|uniref:YgjV family protein n=1 Tax=Shewanella TaxID=22 RepID=UPI001BC4C2BE|nr:MULTISPECIES: YgjV family protein [Shewanella]GIU52260.1 membrane protein [Shewanella sp. KT0246]